MRVAPCWRCVGSRSPFCLWSSHSPVLVFSMSVLSHRRGLVVTEIRLYIVLFLSVLANVEFVVSCKKKKKNLVFIYHWYKT